MARSKRVTHTPTHLLEAELASLLIDWKLDLQHPDAIMDGCCKRCSRWCRVARELARRDYRFRAHGRECTCADCHQLLSEWTDLQRSRMIPHWPRETR